MPIEHLTELQYSKDRKGPFKLYIYDIDSSFHRGGVWFSEKPLYPDEEITTQEAHERSFSAYLRGHEIRVCDGGDMLVFHSKDGNILFGQDFWNEVGRTAFAK